MTCFQADAAMVAARQKEDAKSPSESKKSSNFSSSCLSASLATCSQVSECSTFSFPSSLPNSSTSVTPAETVFMIGIAGGSASGKTSVSNMVIKGINQPNVVLVSMDSFYKVLSPSERERALKGEYDFDAPASFDSELLIQTLQRMKQGLSVEIPEYDFCTHSRTANSTFVPGPLAVDCVSLEEEQEEEVSKKPLVVIFEGIMALHFPEVLSLMDLKVFVDTDDDVRLARRLIRDISERGRCTEGVLQMYFKFAKPGYDNFIFPSSRNADVIIPRGADNFVAINILINHIRERLGQIN